MAASQTATSLTVGGTFDPSKLTSVQYSVDCSRKLAWISLNRPERFNAIDGRMPHELYRCVCAANSDDRVKVILLKGNGRFFCSGYDLKSINESSPSSSSSFQSEWYSKLIQRLPWDPSTDFEMMGPAQCPPGFTHCYMSLFHSKKPTIAMVHGGAVGGGSDIALCADFLLMTANSIIGYPPARLWGVPTTAMWALKCGMNIQKAKLLVLSGRLIDGRSAEHEFGLALKGDFADVDSMHEYAMELAGNLSAVPSNQLWFNKTVLNRIAQGTYGGSIESVQELASVLDGASRHTPEGVGFREMTKKHGFKKAVQLRDSGQDITEGLDFEPLKTQSELKPFLTQPSKL